MKLKFCICLLLIVSGGAGLSQSMPVKLFVNDTGYFDKHGLNVLVFSSHYGLFGDEKLSGVEIIHQRNPELKRKIML